MTNKELEQIYNEGYKAVYWTAMSFLKNEEDAEDIVQDVFVTLIKSYDSIKDKDKVIPWLKKTAANRCLDKIKLNKTDNAEDEFFDSIEALPEDFLPDSIVESDEARAIIVDIINNSLSEDVRMTLVMFYFDEMSTKEIAEALDVPAGTVSWRISFAKKTIKKEVEKYEEKNKTKLFGMGLPFLTRLFMKEAEQISLKPIPSSLIQTLTNPSASSGLPAKEAANTLKAATTKAAKEGTGLMFKKILISTAAVALAGTAAVVTFTKMKPEEPEPLSKPAVETIALKKEKKKDASVKIKTTSAPAVLTAPPTPTKPVRPTMEVDGQVAQALFDALMDISYYGYTPNSNVAIYDTLKKDKTTWAFFDVDKDGKNELIVYEFANPYYIEYGNGYIYDYDPEKDEWKVQLATSADNHFYDNGVVISTGIIGLGFPDNNTSSPVVCESVYTYDPEKDKYNYPNYATRWTKDIFRKLHPDEEVPAKLEALKGSDYLYYIHANGIDPDDYYGKDVRDSVFNPHIEGAAELHPEFMPLTDSAVIEFVKNMHY